jgi:hypothetical protein
MGAGEFGVYFPIMPARSYRVMIEPTPASAASHVWIQAAARVQSGSVSMSSAGGSHSGSYAPLSTRIEQRSSYGGQGPTLEVSADLAAGARQAVKLAIAQQGREVWSMDTHPAGVVAVAAAWPIAIQTDAHTSGGMTFTWHFAQPGEIRVTRSGGFGDTTVTGDALRIMGPLSSTMLLSESELSASGLNSMRVSNPTLIGGSATPGKATPKPKGSTAH